MAEESKTKEAEEILTEFQSRSESTETETSENNSVQETQDDLAEKEKTHDVNNEETEEKDRDVIFIGSKPIMTYVTATLTQLSTQPTVTIKARGKRITQAVDVSQMIVKRMNTVGYKISDVRISSDSLKSQDGKLRNVSTIEVDISKH